MRVEAVHPREIGPSEVALWRARQAADPNLASPYFAPEWAKLVGAVRPDARVCVIEFGKGFMGVQRSSRFAAMGLGAPIADYQGVVGERGLPIDRVALCRALRVGRIDLVGVPEGQAVLAGRVAGGEGSWIADVSGGLEAYRAHFKSARPKIARQTDSRLRKLAEQHGEPVFTAISTDRQHFDTLMRWKLTQLRASGQPAIWAKPWVRRVLDATFELRESELAGAFFTLTVGDRLVAANYCLRSSRALHGWVLGHDPAFDAFSPGMQIARMTIEWAAQNGLSEVDFGGGDYQFKRHLATGQRRIEWGSLARPSWSGAVRDAEFALRARMERMPQERFATLPGKAMRRLDLMRGLHVAGAAR